MSNMKYENSNSALESSLKLNCTTLARQWTEHKTVPYCWR